MGQELHSPYLQNVYITTDTSMHCTVHSITAADKSRCMSSLQ